MFICNDCLKENFTNGESLAKSGGKCEYCGENAICNDIQSKRLNPKPKMPIPGITDLQGEPKSGGMDFFNEPVCSLATLSFPVRPDGARVCPDTGAWIMEE